MQRETCEPPPEHAHHEWHWLRREIDDRVRWHCARWTGLKLIVHGGFSEEVMYRTGWRYLGPAIPPTEGEG